MNPNKTEASPEPKFKACGNARELLDVNQTEAEIVSIWHYPDRLNSHVIEREVNAMLTSRKLGQLLAVSIDRTVTAPCGDILVRGLTVKGLRGQHNSGGDIHFLEMLYPGEEFFNFEAAKNRFTADYPQAEILYLAYASNSCCSTIWVFYEHYFDLF